MIELVLKLILNKLNMIDIDVYIERRECFPALCLNNQILLELEKLISLDLDGLIKNGLNKSITLNENKGPIKCPAEIITKTSDENHFFDCIKLSAAYCQFLWSISYVALNVYDCNNVNDELEANPTYRNKLEKEFERHEEILSSELNQELKEKYQEEFDVVKHIYKYLDKDKVMSDYYNVLEGGLSLLKNEVDDFGKYYDMPNALDESNAKVNGIYLYAVLFVLIHEIQHFSLEHKESTIENEFEADSAAFWTLFSDLKKEEKVSANVGVLTALCSLLFFDKNLDGGGTHPDNDDRIMKVLKNINEENPHYIGFVATIFNMWAYYFNVEKIKELHNRKYNDNIEYLNDILKICKNINN